MSSFKTQNKKLQPGTVLIGENGLPVDTIATIASSNQIIAGVNQPLSYNAGVVTAPAGVDLNPVRFHKSRYTGRLILVTNEGATYFIDRVSVNPATNTFNIYTDLIYSAAPMSIDSSQGWVLAEAEIVNRLATTSSAKIDQVEFRDIQFQLELDGDPVSVQGTNGNTLEPNSDGSINVRGEISLVEGGVRFGVFLNGIVTYCHEYRPSNTLSVPFTRTPVLPIRYEIRNTAATASSSTMTQGTLGLVIDDSGSILEPVLQFSASREASGKSIGNTLVPLLSIRPKLTFNGNVNRIPINITDVYVASETQILYYQVLRNAILTGDTFNSAGANSAVEVDTAATSYTGGEKLSEGYVIASSQGSTRILASSQTSLNKLNFIGLSIDGTVQENLVVVARTVTSTSLSFAVLNWEEFQ